MVYPYTIKPPEQFFLCKARSRALENKVPQASSAYFFSRDKNIALTELRPPTLSSPYGWPMESRLALDYSVPYQPLTDTARRAFDGGQLPDAIASLYRTLAENEHPQTNSGYDEEEERHEKKIVEASSSEIDLAFKLFHLRDILPKGPPKLIRTMAIVDPSVEPTPSDVPCKDLTNEKPRPPAAYNSSTTAPNVVVPVPLLHAHTLTATLAQGVILTNASFDTVAGR
ncbi:hypothetical protein BC835DRAFT_1309990 [Cytidiella melzeri]|nr:hypothetical protein BC835DRAFT_1309990 [Cytidiella melzeri]